MIVHLDARSSPRSVAQILGRDGCVVVDQLVPVDVVDRVLDEMAPFISATEPGPDDFAGASTTRTGGLVARSRAARELVRHPHVLATVGEVLGHATNFQLHLTQIIGLLPGQEAQPIHRDQWAFDFFPFPSGYEVQCNCMWALTDFTAANGATRVAVASHTREDRLKLSIADTEPAEMRRGSVLFYTGSLYHGGGPNTTDEVRYGANITYNVAWLRQEENQYLTVPLDVARELDDDLLRLIGYDRGAYALGYVDDLRDPIEVVRAGRGLTGFGDSAIIDRRQDSESSHL